MQEDQVEVEVAEQPDITKILASHPPNVINYKEKKISASYNCEDATMNDSDCSEDYNNDPFFQ